MPERTWFSAKKSDKDVMVAEVSIYDEIGYWGVTAKDFRAALDALGDVARIDLRINSPGGDVFVGLTIFNMLERHEAEIVVTVDGIAASIASVIAMAGNRIVMPENAFLMIHDPSGFVIGGADDMRDLADVLEKVKASMVGIYATRSGQKPEKIGELMAAETWLSAQEAKDLGLADEVAKPRRMAASASMLERFQAAPKALRQAVARADAARAKEAAMPKELEELTAALAAEKEARAKAEAELADVKAKAETDAKAALEAEQARVAEITKLVATAHKANPSLKAGEMVASYIKDKLTAEQVSAKLLDALATAQSPDIRNTAGGGPSKGAAGGDHGWGDVIAKLPGAPKAA